MDDLIIVSDRMLRRVSLAISLIDDVTGNAVTGSNARAWIPEEKPPVRKSDGWFVFTDLTPGRYTIFAEGGKFQRQSADCDISGGGYQTITMRLRPARTYPDIPGYLRIEGRAEAGAEITVYVTDKQTAFKLLADAEKGGTGIHIFHGENENLAGGTFRLLASDGEGENVTVLSADENDRMLYRISVPLERDYPRLGTVLVPTASTRADEKGRFFLVLKGSSSCARIICEAAGSRNIRMELDREGRDNISVVLE